MVRVPRCVASGTRPADDARGVHESRQGRRVYLLGRGAPRRPWKYLGRSAFKFGIYCRAKTEVKEGGSGRVYGEKYAWLAKYGATEQEAFAAVRSLLVEVIRAAREGNLARIEEVDLSPMFKWKVAFLYQDRKSPILFPIFAKEALFRHYRLIDPTAKLVSTPYHVMYETLLERHRELGDVFAIAEVSLAAVRGGQNSSASRVGRAAVMDRRSHSNRVALLKESGRA